MLKQPLRAGGEKGLSESPPGVTEREDKGPGVCEREGKKLDGPRTFFKNPKCICREQEGLRFKL